MRLSRQDGLCRGIHRLGKARTGFLWALLLLPGAASAADTFGVADPIPPPGTYFSAFVSDSATGQPLAGADLNIRNPQALFSVTHTDSSGWAHVARSGLPYNGSYSTQVQWVTASYPGYVAQMAICGVGDTANHVLRYALSRATAKNSITFTGTMIDSATRMPLPFLAIDFSHGEKGGYMTYLTTTDGDGNFIITGIPAGHSEGYFWVRKPNRSEYFLLVNLTQGGKPIIVSGLATTALEAPRNRMRAAAKGKSAPAILFRSRNRDATGRRRD
jgi:hypothetical protein